MNSQPINPDKSRYKLRNWKEYNSNLCKLGSLSMFPSSEILREWDGLRNKKKEFGEVTYSDSIIPCCLLLKINYGLKLRQSTGFISSLFLLLNKSYLPIPDYSTLCRRQSVVPTEIETRLNQGENLVAGIDSTGLKVYGEGEWKVRKHGWSKHGWSKHHICMDLNTQHILCADLTGNNEDDASVGGRMLKGACARIKSFKRDGACDRFGFGEVLYFPLCHAKIQTDVLLMAYHVQR